MECIEGTGQLIKREEIHFSLYSKTNRGNSPNKTMLSQEHINTPKQNILIQFFSALNKTNGQKEQHPSHIRHSVFVFWRK
jgi:hypothetical protein